MTIDTILFLIFGFLSVTGVYLRMWQNSRNARDSMEVELRSQIAKLRDERCVIEKELRSQLGKMETRLKECEDRWEEYYRSLLA